MSSFDAIIQAAKERQKAAATKTETTPKARASGKTSAMAQATLPLDKIVEREANTRGLRQAHVEALAESISVLGLLEPLVVDNNNRLLAGGHRLAAIQLLAKKAPDAYKKHFPKGRIPIRTLSFDAQRDPDRALQVEVAENEHRRDYTPAEVRALAERLQSAGYVYQRGRPVKGSKPLRPALEVIVGKSLRTVQRYLNRDEEKPRPNRVSERKILRQTLKQLQGWQSISPPESLTPKRQTLAKQLPKFLKLIEAAIEEAQD
jgi:ParB family chromosome partitioning protein